MHSFMSIINKVMEDIGMDKKEAMKILNEGSQISFEDYFLNKPIKIYQYNREEFYFLYDFGQGEEKFVSWEGLVTKID